MLSNAAVFWVLVVLFFFLFWYSDKRQIIISSLFFHSQKGDKFMRLERRFYEWSEEIVVSVSVTVCYQRISCDIILRVSVVRSLSANKIKSLFSFDLHSAPPNSHGNKNAILKELKSNIYDEASNTIYIHKANVSKTWALIGIRNTKLHSLTLQLNGSNLRAAIVWRFVIRCDNRKFSSRHCFKLFIEEFTDAKYGVVVSIRRHTVHCHISNIQYSLHRCHYEYLFSRGARRDATKGNSIHLHIS